MALKIFYVNSHNYTDSPKSVIIIIFLIDGQINVKMKIEGEIDIWRTRDAFPEFP